MAFDPGSWANKLILTIDSSKVDQDLTDFPVLIALSSGTGITNFDASAVLSELTPASGTLASGTVLLIHAEGSDSSTSFTDESPSGHIITATADAQISTAQYKFGVSCAYFDGTGDYLDVADSADWDFGTGDFTIDWWMLQNATFPPGKDIFSAGRLSNPGWLIHISSGPTFYHNGSSIFSPSYTEITGIWRHWALVRQGDNMYWFVDGLQIGSTGTGHSARDINGSTYLRVGGDTSGADPNAYMDEMRISKGVARWTSNFILPTGPYGSSWDNRKKIAVTTSVSGVETELPVEIDYWESSGSRARTVISAAYYEGTDSDGQASLGTSAAHFIDDATGTYTNLGPGRTAASVGGDLGVPKTVSMIETTADSNAWSNFKIFYNSTNGSSGWTQVSGLNLEIYNGTPHGLGGNYLNQWTFDPVEARWWKIWGNDGASTGVMSVRELEIYASAADQVATLWTKVPTISSGTNTTLNVYYDSTQDDSIYVGDTGDFIAQEVWDSNFVGVWHMSQDPAANNIFDSTSNSNDGTPVGSMASNDLVNGKIGKALNFDGSDDHLTVPDSANWDFGTDDFTLKSWIRLDSIPSVGRMIARGDVTGTNGDWAWGVGTTWGGGTKFNFADYSGGVTDHLSDALSLSTDTWYHFIVARDSGTLRFFLNNVAVGTASCDHSLNSSDIIYIGCRDDAGTVEFFPGDLDKVTISKGIYRSLSWQKATYYSELDTLITYSLIEPTIFTFSGPIPVHLSTVYGLSHTLQLTTTITGADTPYVYSATFFDSGDTQIGSTVAGLNSGDQASSTSPLATPAGTDYSWYVTATSSGESDTSQTYTFTNRFLAEGYTEIDSTRASGVSVRLYRRSTGVLVGSDTSAGISGTFSIETTFNEAHYAVALHPTDSGTNALIFDYVTP